MNDSSTPTPHQLLDARFAAAAERYLAATPTANKTGVDLTLDDAHDDPAYHLGYGTETPTTDDMLALTDDDFYARFLTSLELPYTDTDD